MQRTFFKRISLLLATVATAALMLNGCSGSNGSDGANGTNGTNAGPVNVTALSAEDQAKVAYTGEVTSVTINSPPVVTFKVTDGNGNPVVGLGVKNAAGTQLNNLKFALAKLVPGVNGSPSKWVSYIVTTVPTATAPLAGARPTQDREGTLVDNGDGTYKYTFYRDITKVKDDVAGLTDSGLNLKAALGDLTFEPNLTHRLVIEYGGNVFNTSPSIAIDKPMNIIYDFIPATGKVVTATDSQREIATTEACNSCHGQIGKTTPHGGRADIRYCAVCHTSQRVYGRAVVTSSAAGVIPATSNAYVVDGEALPELVTMIHKIHAGSAIYGTSLKKTGYNYAGFMYEKFKGFPMSPANCRVCHKAETSLQGDNWNMKPSRQACGSCHDSVNFATGAGHSAGNLVQTSDANCVTCHNAAAIKGYHMQVNKTVNNPETPAGLVNFTYEISSATVNATTNSLAVKFRILGDGTPVTFAAPAAALANPLSGFTGSPSFLLAYAKSGDKQTMTTFADYNNLGKNAAQPASVSIANLLDTNRALTSGTISGPDASGFYTANIVSAAAFPVGSKLRAVALQGYFTQISPAAARHTVSVIKSVTGDAVRRTVVDPAKCGKCHEWFEGHGGNRVYETQVCVTCHVPNLSTSGRGVADAALVAYAFTPEETAILTSWGFDKTLVNAALAFPEASNNFKDMIHGIHAGKDRTVPLRFVRDRTTVILPFDTAGFTFPNLLKNCDACHVSAPAGTNRQTYKADLPAGVLASTAVTTNGAIATTADVKTSRLGANLPNATDIVTAPIAAACVSCHTSAVAVAHMNTNGGNIATSRTQASGFNIQGSTTRSSVIVTSEQCALCHGEGKAADVVKVHAK